MAATAQPDLHAAVLLAQEGERRGHEALAVVPGQQHLVGGGEHVLGAVVNMRERADRVPGGRRHRRRILALAADVADRDRPPVGRREHVIEVAAVSCHCGRRCRPRELEPRHRRQARGHQAGLQRFGRLGLAAEHPVDSDRGGQVLAEVLGQAEVGDRERPVGRLPSQRQRAVAGAPVGDRDEISEVAPSVISSGVPPGPVPRTEGSSACASSTDLPVECTCQGADSGSGSIDRTVRTTLSACPCRRAARPRTGGAAGRRGRCR